MDQVSVSLLSTFTVALLHTLIPSHWLCFVVVGRAQGWRPGRTLAVTAAAGLVHVAAAIVLGMVLGRAFAEHQEKLERVSAFVLIALGALYLILYFLRTGHHHDRDQAMTGRAAFVALLFSLALSPCSAAIPLLVASAGNLGSIALLTGVLLVTTVGGMMLLVGLTLLGIERLQFRFFDRYEKPIVGLVLCALGALTLLVHH